jgi:peptidoglycan/xylan/chitin deacetylase (PgdA/CDA1 family)
MKINLPILFYHKIHKPRPGARGINLYVPPARFEQQMRYLHRRGYKSIALEDAIEKIRQGRPITPKSVVITFDDGYLDNYEYALPILKKYDFTATIFMVTDFAGKDTKWPHSKETLPERLLSWDNIREMAQQGISFGSHTCNHWNLNRLSADQISYELIESKKKLEHELQKEVTTFCYPYGEYNSQVVDLVKKSGYRGACATDHGNRHTPGDVYTLKRVFIWNDTPLRKFGYYLSWFYDFEHARKQRRKALKKEKSLG